MATSGAYERGEQIIDARYRALSRAPLSLTVAGPSLTLADVYATAGFAMGEDGIAWAAAQPGYDVYGVNADGRVRYSEGFAALMAPSTPPG